MEVAVRPLRELSGGAVIEIQGPVAPDEYEGLARALKAAIGRHKIVVADLRGLGQPPDAEIVGKLFAAVFAARRGGGEVALAMAPEQAEPLASTGLASCLAIAPTVEAAAELLRERGLA